MEEVMNIAQIRASIFYPQTIGFTPENGAKYKEMFLQNGTIAPAVPFPEMPFNNLPLGMPWQLIGQDSDKNNIIVAFLPNKIDIIKNVDVLNENTESEFIKFCTEKFKIFLDDVKTQAVRLAYSPLITMDNYEPEHRTEAWQHVIKQAAVDGCPCTDINLSFLIKKEKQVGDKNVGVNFLFKMMDGFKMKDGVKTSDSILVQLDINTIPETNHVFSSKEIDGFMNGAKVWKTEFIESILK